MKNMAFKFHYDKENDILAIYNYSKKVSESVEFSEDIILDLDDNGRIIGVEIFYASEFLFAFNRDLDKDFLNDLESASLEYKEFRNMWFVVLALKSGKKVVYQPMPPLKKSEYISPLIANY